MDAANYARTPFGSAERTPGTYGYTAFFPQPIPRSLDLSPITVTKMADAEAALGRLAGAGRLLPSPQLLVGPYLRREAVASTRIEGTQASLTDVYDAEADDLPLGPDVEEVINYVLAIETGARPTRNPATQHPPDSRNDAEELPSPECAAVNASPAKSRTTRRIGRLPRATDDSNIRPAASRRVSRPPRRPGGFRS